MPQPQLPKMTKVTVCGAVGGIGQPLSLLLKVNPHVSLLALYDIVNAAGVAADLSHINTGATVTGYLPKSKDDTQTVKDALRGADLVVIPAGVPRKPGMTRADLFNINALIVRDLVANAAQVCPDAAILIISNPVNATVAIAAAVLKKLGVFNPRKLFGVTTLDAVRAETFLGTLIGENPASLRGKIAVVGGHSGDTIVPLIHFDHTIAAKVRALPEQTYKEFVWRVQYGGDEVVQAKNGAGSATLSMAYAGSRFAEYVLESLAHKEQEFRVPESSYVQLEGIGALALAHKLGGPAFFSVPVILKNGQVHSFIDPLSLVQTAQESQMIETAVTGLTASIAQGTAFVEGLKL